MPNEAPPDISEEELTFRPRVVSEKFAEELEGMISIWTARYPEQFNRYDAIIILEELRVRLEREENTSRRQHKLRKMQKEDEHGQYAWVEYRQQWVPINGLEAQRLRLLQEDDDRSVP